MTDLAPVSAPDGEPSEDAVFEHDAFISYKHRTEGEVAAALESGLEHLAKPKGERRALDVFRDESDLAGGSDLAGMLRRHMDGSDYLVLVASPTAADPAEDAGYWVNEELKYWLSLGDGADEDSPSQESRLLIALAEGELVFHSDSGRVDTENSTAAPAALQSLDVEPLWVDFRDIEPNLKDSEFKAAVARLQAEIRGMRLDEIFAIDLEQAKRRRRLRNWLVGLFAVLFLAASAAAIVALFYFNDANNKKRTIEEQAGTLDQLGQGIEDAQAVLEEQTALVDEKTREADEASQRAAEQTALAGEKTREADEASQRAAEQTALAGEKTTEAETAVAEAARQQTIAAAARGEADRQLAIAEADRLATASRQSADPDLAALLALAAVDTTLEPYSFVTSSADAAVYAVAMSPWRLTLRGHAGANDSVIGVGSAEFSPDGTRILTNASDNARVWDAVTGAELASITRQDNFGFLSAKFSPDGSRIVTAGANTANVWDVNSPAPVWDGQSGALLLTLPVPKIKAADYGPDGSRIVTEEGLFIDLIGSKTKVWDAASGALLMRLEGGGPNFSPDGTRIATIASDGVTVNVWDATSGALVATLETAQELGVVSAEFSPDGSLIVTACRSPCLLSGGKTGAVWNAASGTLIARLVADNAASNDGTAKVAVISAEFGTDFSIVTASEDGTARVWEVLVQEFPGSAVLVATLGGHAAAVESAHFNSDGTRVVTASGDGTAKVFDSGGRLIVTLEGHIGFVESADFSPDGLRVVTAGTFDSTAKVWRPDAALIETIDTRFRVVSGTGTVGPDGSHLEIPASNPTIVRVVDRDGLLRAVLQGHLFRVISAEFSPDGSRIVTGSFDQTTKVWHPDGTLLATLEGVPVDSTALAVDFDAVGSGIFGADGSRITTTGTDDEPEQRVWSVFSLSEAVAELERRLGGRQLSEDECLAHSIDPCPVG